MTAVTAQSEPARDPREHPISRYELWAVVAITLVGAAVRFAFPSAMAIEHFDEGVYASNLLFPDQGNEYPDRHLYAPSLVPALIEWSIIFFGDKGIAPMLPSLLFGTLTIPLIWWVGRQWFWPTAGLAAAALAAFSDYHILLSRSAMTDATLGFWLLLAVYLFENALHSLNTARAIGAGVATGLAWWTKYNGWLPLAISLSGLLAWSLFAGRDERRFSRRILLWCLAAITAMIAWCPYWWSLPRGYGEIAMNHRGYLVGWSSWMRSAINYGQIFAHWDGQFTCISFGFAWNCLMFSISTAAQQRAVANSQSRFGTLLGRVVGWWFIIVCGCLLVRFIGSLPFLAVNLLVFLTWLGIWFLRQRRPQPQTASISDRECRLKQLLSREIALWMLLAWDVGLLLTTPLYRPYPRLAQTWLTASWLTFGLVFQWSAFRSPKTLTISSQPSTNTVEGEASPPQSLSTSNAKMGLRCLALLTAIVAILGILTFATWAAWSERGFPGWSSRSGLAEIAPKVRGAIREAVKRKPLPVGGTQAVLYVYAEPGLFFHLPADGLAVQPAGNLNFVDIEATRKLPTFLVTGPHAHRSRAFEDEFAKRAEQFERIASYPYDASDFVRLDDVSATQLRAHREPLEVRLYRVRVPE